MPSVLAEGRRTSGRTVVSSIGEGRRRAKARGGENQRRRDSSEIPESLPKCDHCIFYRARGASRTVTSLGAAWPVLRAFYRAGRCGRYTCRSRFSCLFAAQRALGRGLKNSPMPVHARYLFRYSKRRPTRRSLLCEPRHQFPAIPAQIISTICVIDD